METETCPMMTIYFSFMQFNNIFTKQDDLTSNEECVTVYYLFLTKQNISFSFSSNLLRSLSRGMSSCDGASKIIFIFYFILFHFTDLFIFLFIYFGFQK